VRCVLDDGRRQEIKMMGGGSVVRCLVCTGNKMRCRKCDGENLNAGLAMRMLKLVNGSSKRG